MDSLQNENEKYLISKLIRGDLKSFDLLFVKYSEKLFRFAFSILKNEEDAKEIVQESFLRVWKKRKQIDDSKCFKTYLFTISYHLIIDYRRIKIKDKEYRNFLFEYFQRNHLTIPNVIDIDIIKKQIDYAIEELPGKRKEIFIMSREMGLSHRDIANKMGISIKTVENQINLSLKHLKFRLGKDLLLSLFFLVTCFF